MVKLPKVFVAELTPVCNHQCIFCSCPWENDKNYNPTILPATEWKDILTKMDYRLHPGAGKRDFCGFWQNFQDLGSASALVGYKAGGR